MKTKTIPVMITLIAGLITCIMAFITGAGMEKLIRVLLPVIVIFFILGMILKFILDKNFNTVKKDAEEPEQVDSENQDEEQEKLKKSEENRQDE